MTKRQKLKARLFSLFKGKQKEVPQNQLEVSYWEYITLFLNVFKKKTPLSESRKSIH